MRNILKVLSLFSGIGAFEKALINLGIGYDLVNYCEIDKYASKCYSEIFNIPEEKNLWDVTKVNEKELSKGVDLVTYGFPCQDISNAGKQKGFFNEDGSQTRSGLFFDALRIIKEVKPKVAIAENVKALTQKKFKEAFLLVLESLEDAGYNNYWQVLNAKDYGVAQNRERVFIVSIRKDIDTGNFVFPDKIPLKKKLKDYLEENVEEKYYLSEKLQKGFREHAQRHKEKGNGFDFAPTDGSGIGRSITTRAGSRNTDNFLIQVGQCYADNNQAGRVYSKEGLSPTLNTCQGGNLQPKIIDDIYNHRPPREYTDYSPALRAERQGLKVVIENQEGKSDVQLVGQTSFGHHQSNRVYSPDELSIAINTCTPPQISNIQKERNKASEFVGIGHHPFSKKLEFNGFHNDVCPCLIATDYKAPKCVLEKDTKEPIIYDDFNNRIKADQSCIGTLTTNIGSSTPRNGTKIIESTPKQRIRKLTPKECWRLMGFTDEDFEKCRPFTSDSQLYKQAGNSIVVDVCMALLSKVNEIL